MRSPTTTFTAVLALSGLFFAGCGKSGKPAPKAAEQTAAPSTAAPNDSQPAPAPMPQQFVTQNPKKSASKQPQVASPEVTGFIHPFMTEQLHVFIQLKGRMPESFSEFVNTRMDSVPRPPAGFEWAIDRTSREVKLIRK